MGAIYDSANTFITGDQSFYESLAKTALNGKVWIAVGDSYTTQSNVGMGAQLAALATKYGLVLDNRGVASATISWRSDASSRRIYNIVDTVISDYTNGNTLNGTTYHASDVGLITFMAGANDGERIEAWIGEGSTTTDKSTIYGSLHHIFSGLLSTFTAAKIVVATQPANYATTVNEIVSDDHAEAYAVELGFADLAALQVLDDYQLSNTLHGNKETAVKTMAWFYGIPVVDVFNEFPTVMVAANRSAYWQEDKLHLTTDGYDIVAAAMERKIVGVVAKGEH